jgi:hypothetical protein
MRHQSFMNLVPTLIALRQLADDLESIGQDLFAKLLRLISEHDWIEG